MKKIRKAVEVDLSTYTDTETGAMLLDQLPGTSISVTKETDQVRIHYDEYMCIDSVTLQYIRTNKILRPKDLSYVLVLADTLKTDYNALYKRNNNVHTIESISTELEITYNNARLLVDRLVKKGILYKFSGYRDDQPFKAYLMNPFFARKRKNVNIECSSLFQQFGNEKSIPAN